MLVSDGEFPIVLRQNMPSWYGALVFIVLPGIALSLYQDNHRFIAALTLLFAVIAWLQRSSYIASLCLDHNGFTIKTLFLTKKVSWACAKDFCVIRCQSRLIVNAFNE